MKKVLLLVFCAVAMLTVQAQPTVTNNWTKSQTDILSVTNVNNSNPVAVSAQGDMYATGLFTESFTFGGKEIEAVATSSYLLKYGTDGAEKWGVALTGAATIKTITTDGAGNVYIAGNFADELTFGSTDGNTQVKEGIKMDGTPIADQAAGFVAKYDVNGVLKAVQSFVSKPLPELEATGIYFPEAGDYRFDINNIAYSDGKLYASASYKGLTENNGFSFKGGYFDLDGGGFWYGDLVSGAVFSLNDQLEVDGILANMGVTGGKSTDLSSVQSVSFAVAEGKLYSGFVASGKQTLTIGSKEQAFDLSQENGVTEYGHILSIIDLADGSSSLTKKYSTTHDVSGNYCFIKSMLVKGDVLLLGGTFNAKLAFDQNIDAVSTNDLYVAVLNKNTLDVNNAVASKINEGDANSKKEEFGGMTVCGDYVYMIGHTAVIASHAVETPLTFWIDTTNGTMTQTNPANLATGVAASGTKLAIAQTQIADQKLENIFSLNEVSNATGISSTEQGAGVSVYPNPVVDVLNFTTPCDVVIINLMGATVKQAENVSSLPVSDLISGQYIIKLTTEDGTSTVKVIKK